MTPITYFAYIHEPEPGAWLLRFFDVPEAIAQGDTLEEAIGNAPDALAAALEGYLELNRPLPTPARIDPRQSAPDFTVVEVPAMPSIAARALLAQAMRDRGVSKVGLAKLMARDEKVIRRILSGRGASLDLTLEALRAVGVVPALAA
jgi:antitoxin HicB